MEDNRNVMWKEAKNQSEGVKEMETKVEAERRGSTEIIAEILEIAKGGKTISALTVTSNATTVNRYLPLLLKRGLLKIEKTEKYFVSEDGRKYGVLYITTKKGLAFLEGFHKLLSFMIYETNSHLVGEGK